MYTTTRRIYLILSALYLSAASMVAAAESSGETADKGVEQPYFGVHLLGSRAYSRNSDPDYHTNTQTGGLEVVLPIGHSFGAKLTGAYALSDISLSAPCGQVAVKNGMAQGFWRNPNRGKLGAYVGRTVNGNCVADNDSYQNYGVVGEYYFAQGWAGVTANYLRADAIRSGGGVDADSYVLTAEWQPELFTAAATLTRSFQTPVAQDAASVMVPRETLSSTAGNVNFTRYLHPNLALNIGLGQTLHNSNGAPNHGATQVGIRWQPEAAGQALELAAKADITHDTRAIGLRLSYYFDSKTTLIYRDRNLRY